MPTYREDKSPKVVPCASCGKTCVRPAIWFRRNSQPVWCRSCSSTHRNRARYPNGPTPFDLTCIDCGKTRTVAKISSLATKPLRCKSCAMKAVVTPEMRAARSKRFSGAGSNFWQGGISEEHERQRNEARYRAWRRAVFQRDGYTCQHCGLIGGALHADHIKPFAHYPALRYDTSNGRTLCVACHRKTPTFGNKSVRRTAKE